MIDVNGDQSMEWSEFVSFCIEAGMAAVKREPKAAFGLTWDMRYSDPISHGSGYVHSVFIGELNAAVVVEKGSKLLRFLSPRLVHVASLDASDMIRANKRNLDMSTVSGFAYIPSMKLMAVLLSCNLAGLWSLTDKDTWRFADVLPRPPGEGTATTICYEPCSHTLVLGTSTGALHIYSPGERKVLRSLTHAATEGAAHKDVILSLVAVPSQQALVSACLDGSINVWDSGRWKLRKTLTTGSHAPGGHIQKLLACEPAGAGPPPPAVVASSSSSSSGESPSGNGGSGSLRSSLNQGTPGANMVWGLSAKNAIVGFDLSVGEATVALHFHHSTVVDFSLLPSSPPRLISMDSDATFRLWDVGDAALGQATCTLTYHVPQLAAHAPRVCALMVPQRFIRRIPVPGGEEGNATASSSTSSGSNSHIHGNEDGAVADASTTRAAAAPASSSSSSSSSGYYRALGSQALQSETANIAAAAARGSTDSDDDTLSSAHSAGTGAGRGSASGAGGSSMYSPLGPFGDLLVCTTRLHRVTTCEVDAAAPPAVGLYNPTMLGFVTAEGVSARLLLL